MKSERLEEAIYRPFSGIVQDFISGKGALSDIFPARFQLSGVADLIERRKKAQPDRQLLVRALKEQYKRADIDFTADVVLSEQLTRLESANTFTITTGHQLNLCTGPLYCLIKAIQIIKMADEVNKSGDHHIVPVFWLASEDHDFEEINHVHVFGKTLRWTDEQGGATGEYQTASLRTTLDDMFQLLGETAYASELKMLFDEAYGRQHSLATASRILLHRLLGEKGLVVIDGHDADLKASIIPLMQRELEEGLLFREVQQTNDRISPIHPVQVNPREINLFYLAPGSRERIQHDGKIYFTEAGKRWSKEEILAELRKKPNHFSPNVILRPLYEETILPNLAYVGGPGEVAYWMQLKSAFDAFGVFLPAVGLRNSLFWIDQHKQKKLAKLELEYTDLFLQEPEITKKLIRFDEVSDEINDDIDQLNKAVQSIAEKTAVVDESVKAFVLAEGRRIEKSVEQIIKRFIKAKKNKNEEAVKSFWTVHEKLFPNGSLHERYDNFVPYYLQHGKQFLDQIYNLIDPEDARLIVVQE